MSVHRLKQGLVAVALLVSAACADNGLEPRSAPPATVSASLIGKVVKLKGDTTVTQFVINPKTSTYFDVGSKHGLYIPARAVCDPATSSYGMAEWDKPCEPLKQTLVITARTWIGSDDLPKVEFSPALRFTSDKWGNDVTLYMSVKSSDEAARGLTILYCPTTTSSCIDESLTDASLTTQVSASGNVVYRRIKHFSVYNVSSGRAAAAPEEAN